MSEVVPAAGGDYHFGQPAPNNDSHSMQSMASVQSAGNAAGKATRSQTNDSTAEKIRKKYAGETKEESLNRFRKFACQNIVNSCLFLEHEERYNNQPKQKELDKD